MATKDLIEHIRRNASDAQNVIAEFRKGFEADPANALSWGDDAFEAAAQLRVFSHALSFFTVDDGREALGRYSLEHVVRGARNPKRSTGLTSNLIDRYETAAWAVVYGWTRDFSK